MLDFLGLASQASSEKEKPRSFRMSSELANVAPTEEEVKYLFVNLPISGCIPKKHPLTAAVIHSLAN